MKKTAQQRIADIDAKMQRYLRRLDRLHVEQIEVEIAINETDERICALRELRARYAPEVDDEVE